MSTQENYRYKIVSQSQSTITKRWSVGILDQHDKKVFVAPVRLVAADGDFLQQMNQLDVRLVSIINEEERIQLNDQRCLSDKIVEGAQE